MRRCAHARCLAWSLETVIGRRKKKKKCATVASRARAAPSSHFSPDTVLAIIHRWPLWWGATEQTQPGSQLVPGTGYRRTTSRYRSRAFHYGALDHFVHPTSNYHSFARRLPAIKTTCRERFLYLEEPGLTASVFFSSSSLVGLLVNLKWDFVLTMFRLRCCITTDVITGVEWIVNRFKKSWLTKRIDSAWFQFHTPPLKRFASWCLAIFLLFLHYRIRIRIIVILFWI